MSKILRIGTRDSQLAVWQASFVQDLLKRSGIASELVFIKSEGDMDTVTPLYAIGVTGIFTKTLDAALLANKIDIAVHSMKDVPVQLAKGIRQAAVLKRGSHKDILVPHPDLRDGNAILGMGEIEIAEVVLSKTGSTTEESSRTKQTVNTGGPIDAIIATSSIRRIAQWRRRYPSHKIENLRGNVNTRLRKLKESNWQGAIFAAAGLERIDLRPENAIDLDWMLPAPAQGAIMIACRENDDYTLQSCEPFNHEETALCTKIERDFLSALMGGCSTPISALAEVKNGEVVFKGNIMSPDSYHMVECQAGGSLKDACDMGFSAAKNILSNGGQAVVDLLRNKGLIKNDEV
jgi:hydroxymethylbilane synthase